jgi:hypothetical protein
MPRRWDVARAKAQRRLRKRLKREGLYRSGGHGLSQTLPQTCRAKGLRGNLYPDAASAAIAAAQMRQRRGEPRIEHYRCNICGQWHLGKPAKSS